MERKFRAVLTLRAASRLFVVPSEYTKTSLVRRFPFIEPAQLLALYSPSTILAELPAQRRRLPQVVADCPREFVLLVSGDRWVKNSFRALQALERLYASCELSTRWPVVITGKCPRWFPSRWRRLFRFVGRVSSAELAGMYATAGLFIYPSLNEGFGYPPIEAMSYGTPVLASGIGATTEIAADGAAYFCPLDAHDIDTRIGTFLHNAALREDLSRKASERYRLVKERQERDLGALCDLLLS
jgi:glycosyltransferase involved in cell wall biosynthesis